jgi:hypothetical protein
MNLGASLTRTLKYRTPLIGEHHEVHEIFNFKTQFSSPLVSVALPS